MAYGTSMKYFEKCRLGLGPYELVPLLLIHEEELDTVDGSSLGTLLILSLKGLKDMMLFMMM